MKKAEVVSYRFWVIAVLAVVIIMGYVKVSIPYKESFKKDSSLKRRNRFPHIKKSLIGAEGGSQNKCITKRG